MSERSAVVVGAGVGGLATAVALTGAGWRVQVLERHERLRADGAGLQLWANGVRALGALGMGGALDAITDRRSRGPAGLRAPDGKWLVRPDQAPGESVFAHRQDLHEALVAALGEGVAVRTSATVTGLRLGDAPAVRLGGETITADLVVGADGASSLARTSVDNHARLVGAGRVAWRAVVPSFRAPELSGACETRGDGLRFAYAGLGHHGVYWTAEAQGSVRPESPAGQLDLLRRWFAGWHEPVGQLIAATRPEELLQNPVEYLDPLPRAFAHAGSTAGVALVGDAAHALTTDLGQGAGLALEDAVTLGACLRGRTVPEGLRRYDELRRHRVTRLAKASRRAGAAKGGALRTALMRALPDRAQAKGSPAVTDWTPPEG
ncbi:FAD-dependent oxidoreductase [Actinorhabdospora filicis]|uniref:FAD-dependent oxidoreductase n=1 Tax=Actinorhabdospora filicis TaxID=1785913 RepID=A0A9W6SDM6_9ACTN|nr:FAD-dependent monooxygenase [Actinorhabdospora filicis]GLZ75325.1 FAD-dependent oxidoreductase [Actinorhabdospora filicis]